MNDLAPVDGGSRARKSACIALLKRGILTQSIPPGQYLDESELAEQYGISRPPLREVLRELAGEGFVILHPNRGAQVTPMSQSAMRNFFMVAPMIYAAASRLAAENATPQQIDRLKECQRQFRLAVADDDAAERTLCNERFHALIGEMAANEYLLPSLKRLLIDHTRIGMTFYGPHNHDFDREQQQAADQHDEFIALIEAKDAQGAAEIAVAHWELSRTQIENFVTPASIDLPLGQALTGI